MEAVTLAGAVIAITKVVKDLAPQVAGIVTVLVAVVLGGLAGYQHVLDTPDVLTGVLTALAAVGVVTVADRTKK